MYIYIKLILFYGFNLIKKNDVYNKKSDTTRFKTLIIILVSKPQLIVKNALKLSYNKNLSLLKPNALAQLRRSTTI